MNHTMLASGASRSTLHAPRSTLFAPRSSLLALLFLASGCAYHLEGVVTTGPTSGALLVDKDDPRLAEAGMSGAMVQATIDPTAMHPAQLPTSSTDGRGHFSLEVPQFGAGLLEYEILVVAQHGGYRPVEHLGPLPGSDKRLLIIMTPGSDQYQPRTNILNDTLKSVPPEWSR